MTNLGKTVLSLTILVLASVPLALAQGTYTQIDYPGAMQTLALGIDSAGDVVGYYQDASGNDYGFLSSGGIYSPVTYPGSVTTYLTGINDSGQIVGETHVPNIGFLYDVPTQVFTVINRPGASATLPFAINAGGEIAGALLYGTIHQTQVGFALIGSTEYKIISPPGGSGASVLAITASGTLFGVDNGTSYFSYSDGQYLPVMLPNAPDVRMLGVNPQGTALVGYYNPTSGVIAGFVYQKKILTNLQFPGSNYTLAYGVNRSGEVVGGFEDAQNNFHGFTWTPPADEAKK